MRRTRDEFHHLVDAHFAVGRFQLLAAVRDDQQLVAQPQLGLALRHEILPVAADHHDQRILGQHDVLERMPALEHALVDLDLGQHRLHVLVHIDVEGRFALLVGQSQQVGHAADGRALHQQRDDRREEDHVEQQVGVLDIVHHRIDGEEDRHGAAEPHPRNVEPRPGRELPERQQAGEDRQRPRDEDEEEAHGAAEDQHLGLQQFVAIDEQSQREEHHDLHEPRETVEKDRQGPFLHQFVIADDQSREIDGQVAVAAHQVREGEREEDEGQQQHDVERVVRQSDAVDRPHGQPSDEVAGEGSDDHLHDERHDRHAQPDVLRRVRQHADEQDREHVGHRIVRTALQLEQRPQVLLQPLLLASQDREDRGRIGRGHRGGQQQRQRERHLQPQPRRDEPYEARQDEGRHHHARRGQHDTRPDDRPDLPEGGVHAACEQNDAQRHHADELGDIDRTVGDEIQSEQHAHPEEEQQRRRPETIGHLTGQHRHEKQQRPHQHDILSA